ncbi:recombinase family protein [Actinosynnema sp. CS-041913]|uniref:recombinase family protein n=1 Tax=Actinosynnema sp. CS-041913 TaxID=3239917 RepID=UPI003D93E00D
MGGPEALREWAGPRRVDRAHPLAGPAARAKPSFIRVAFAGRTSTYDQQDPTLSIPRQLRTCHGVLPDTAVVVAHFYDIESGRKDLSDRGRGQAHELFQIPVPRDGGIQDLLDEAERPDRRFDVVICEDISRVGRRSYASTEIEHRLEKAGVMLIAADEPFRLDNTGRRTKTSTQVLTRRVKQGVAEWYVIEMLEKSWDGFETHTEQGYNVGKPCYGYRANNIPHPVPAKRAKGIKKTLLKVHPIEGPVVRKSFGWRVAERLGYQAIADRLNQDLATNPPPTPVEPDRAVGMWTYSNVRDMLTNPKHTGHMVWNRRARKGTGKNRMNPVSEWVWSPEPTHEALVDLETYVLAQQVAERRERSRTTTKSRNPQAKRIYRLHSYLFCVLCGRRLYGKSKWGRAYYVCAPKKAWIPEGHPPSTYWVRESNLLDGLNAFLADHVFGPYRRQLLDASLRMIDQNARQEHQAKIIALRRSITETETKSKRLVRTLEVADDVDQAFIRDINERRADLRSQRDELARQLAEAEDEVQRAPNPTLLDHLPITPVDLVELPDELSRRLFEALRLEIHYDHSSRTATCRVTLLGDTINAVSSTTQEAVVILFPKQKGPAMEMQDLPNGTVCVVPPAGFEPAHPPPEGDRQRPHHHLPATTLSSEITSTS